MSTGTPLCAPQCVIDLARSAMGSIDFDPTVTPQLNRSIGAARILTPWFNDDLKVSEPWISSDGAPVNAMISLYGDGSRCRRLLKKALREHQIGNLHSAVIWLAHTETATKCPWIWDHYVLIPYRRLRPLYYDEELEEARPTSPSAWSLVIGIPPAEGAFGFCNRFAQLSASLGRLIATEPDESWKSGWKQCTGKDYDNRL